MNLEWLIYLIPEFFAITATILFFGIAWCCGRNKRKKESEALLQAGWQWEQLKCPMCGKMALHSKPHPSYHIFLPQLKCGNCGWTNNMYVEERK